MTMRVDDERRCNGCTNGSYSATYIGRRYTEQEIKILFIGLDHGIPQDDCGTVGGCGTNEAIAAEAFDAA